jgi:microcystin-dependent protein
MTTPFLGQITVFPYSFPPYGWMDCAGQLLPISQYTALFSLLGTYYGGNGTSNFALPDLQGRVPISYGQGPGLSEYVIGEMDGAENVTITTATMPTHTHALNATSARSSTNVPGGALAAMSQAGTPIAPIKGLIYSTNAPDTTLPPQQIGAAGGNQPHTNIQPFLVLRYCIAITGVFPSRG